MFVAGILLIAAGVCTSCIQPFCRLKNLRLAFPIGILIAVGFALSLWDRVVSFRGPFGVNLQTVVSKAEGDAQAIAELKVRVENQSATVDAVADKAKTAVSIASIARQRLMEVERTSAQLKEETSKAELLLTEMRRNAEFANLIADAADDSRAAVDDLHKIAVDPKDARSKRAIEAWLNITTSAFSALQLNFPASWAPGVDPAKLSIDQLRDAYFGQALPLGRIAIAQYITSRIDIPSEAKRKFYLEVARSEVSLKNEVYAYKQIAPDLKLDASKLALEPSLESFGK